MKIFKLLFLILLSSNIFSQAPTVAPLWLTDTTVDTNFDKKVYMYKTIEDYKMDKGEYVGEYVVNTWDNVFGHNTLFFKIDGSEKKLNLNTYFGFKVGEFSFVMNTKKPRIPMKVMKQKEKVFYIDGDFYLGMIFNKTNTAESSVTKKPIFYSDNVGSELIEISKIIKNESNNPNLNEFIKCIQKAKDLRSFRDQFQGYFDCINNF